MKILESRAKSIYKLKNIKILKRNNTGLLEVEILKTTLGLFTRKETDGSKKKDFVRFLAFEVTPKSGTIALV